jgi:hypothetical protein
VLLAFHSGREADHSPPSSAEVKEWVELYPHSPNTPSWSGAQGEHKDLQLYLTLKNANGKVAANFMHRSGICMDRSRDLKLVVPEFEAEC